MFSAILRFVRIFGTAVICIATAFSTGGAAAQTYPSKPIKLIVGFPPGGGSDALARLLGAGLSDRLGQPVLVDNKPGANTIVGAVGADPAR